MGRGKQRHNPNKPQNKLRSSPYELCGSYHEESNQRSAYCSYDGEKAASICKGNRHNCLKTHLHRIASMKDNIREEYYRQGV